MRRTPFRMPSLAVIIYLVIGVIIASDRGYLSNLDSVERFFSAVLAVVFWWMLLLGIDLHIDV